MNLTHARTVAVKILVFFVTSALMASMAWAQSAVDTTQVGPVIQGFASFVSKVNKISDAAVNEADFQIFVNMLFNGLAVILIVWALMKYSLKGLSTLELLTNSILLLFVKTLMETFLIWTGVMWATAEGIASSLQNGMIGTPDTFFAPAFIYNVLRSLTFSQENIFNPFMAIVVGFNTFALSIVMVLLSALSYASVLWGFWVYTLAKLTGLVMIPFLLYERLSWLFDGWLRFFVGSLVYYIIARLNVVMVACSIALFAGVKIPFSVEPMAPVELPILSTPFEAIGVVVFMCVGLLALFSTGKFAATIVAGSAGGGMGSAVLGLSRAVARLI
jgi:hypothetical protein